MSWWKQSLTYKKNPEYPTTITYVSKVPPITGILFHPNFFNPTIPKPVATAFQNTLAFKEDLLIVEIVFMVYCIPLHPKKNIL